MKNNSLKEFQCIPGVGPSIANDLYELGYQSVKDLKNQDPQIMYDKHCQQSGFKVDRCILYVFRCAVYYASHEQHASYLLK